MSALPNISYPAIPYGRAYFKGLRLEGCLYVDKTNFIRQLENERYVFLIRPRRFGKTCWLSTLESYYDRREADDFEAVFAGTAIGANPTANRSRYVVLRFDFSLINDALKTLEREFEEYCAMQLQDALENNPDLFSAMALERIMSPSSINGRLNALFLHARRHRVPLYVLIDEYDNFANTILAHEGPDAYHALTHGGGFYRNFFATLKGGTENGSVERLFITGVSPVTMDDVTSGFNIGANLSLLPEYNEMLGFTENEVRGMLETYSNSGSFDQDAETALGTMREWYNGYRFSEAADAIVYNTVMVLHYVKHSIPNKPGPRQLIDVNVRIDYGKLRHLLTGDQVAPPQVAGAHGGRAVLNGNFDLLREAIEEGETDCDIVESFPLADLVLRENFLSLLHYFGLLSIRAVVAGVPRLGIPNQTVRQLMYGFMRGAYRDVGAFSPDLVTLDRLVRRMALEGAWRPVVEHLSATIAEQTGIRDYMQGEQGELGEKVVQTFLAAYLSAPGYFALHTEGELAKGYADIVLEPLSMRYPGMTRGFVIEVKYLGRAPSTKAKASVLAEEAQGQLRRYLSNGLLTRRYPQAEFTGVALVFRGWELVHSAAVEAMPTSHHE